MDEMINKAKYIFLQLAILTCIGCQMSIDDLKTEQNFLRGLALSRETDKPILVHFTGYACMGYNEFYNDLLKSKAILQKLHEEYIVLELYVDDRKEIKVTDTLGLHNLSFSKKAKERFVKAKHIGHINAVIQQDWLNVNFQPLYSIIDADRNILVEPFGYMARDTKRFLNTLEAGIKRYNTR